MPAVAADYLNLMKKEQDIPTLVARPSLTLAEVQVLKLVLERDTTARDAHGGLRGLLSLSADEYATLITLLNRI